MDYLKVELWDQLYFYPQCISTYYKEFFSYFLYLNLIRTKKKQQKQLKPNSIFHYLFILLIELKKKNLILNNISFGIH